MLTRLTTTLDVDAAIQTIKEIVSDMEAAGITPVAGHDINWADVHKFLSFYISQPTKMLCLIGADTVFIADSAPAWYNESVIVATERIWFTRKPGDGVNVIRRYVKWARDEAQAEHIILSSQRNSARVDNFLVRTGFVKQSDEWRLTNVR